MSLYIQGESHLSFSWLRHILVLANRASVVCQFPKLSQQCRLFNSFHLFSMISFRTWLQKMSHH